jgi:hypothetical protein
MATVGINILSTKKYIQRYILFRYIFRVSWIYLGLTEYINVYILFILIVLTLEHLMWRFVLISWYKCTYYHGAN